jgi:hypothetical protein
MPRGERENDKDEDLSSSETEDLSSGEEEADYEEDLKQDVEDLTKEREKQKRIAKRDRKKERKRALKRQRDQLKREIEVMKEERERSQRERSKGREEQRSGSISKAQVRLEMGRMRREQVDRELVLWFSNQLCKDWAKGRCPRKACRWLHTSWNPRVGDLGPPLMTTLAMAKKEAAKSPDKRPRRARLLRRGRGSGNGAMLRTTVMKRSRAS